MSEFVCSPSEHWGNSQDVTAFIEALEIVEKCERHTRPLVRPIQSTPLSSDLVDSDLLVLAASATRLASDPSITCDTSLERSPSEPSSCASSSPSYQRGRRLGWRMRKAGSTPIGDGEDWPRYVHRRSPAFCDRNLKYKARKHAKKQQSQRLMKQKEERHLKKKMDDRRGLMSELLAPLHRTRMSVRVMLIIQHWLRMECGLSLIKSKSIDKRVSHWHEMMIQMVFAFADSIEYLKGDCILSGHKTSVMSAVVSSDGRYLYTASTDKFIYRWDLSKDALIWKWKAHSDIVRALDYHRSGLLVSGSYDSTVRVWDGCDHSLIHLLCNHTDCVYSVKFNNEGDQIISSSADTTLRLWSVKSGRCLKVFFGHTDWLSSAFFMDDGDSILSCSWDRCIKEWSTRSGDCLRTVMVGRKDDVSYLCVNCDQTRLACLRAQSVFIYGWPVISVLRRYHQPCFIASFHPTLPNVLAIAVSGAPFTIQVLDISDGFCFATLRGHSEQCRFICFTPDGRRLVSVSQDKSVRLWDLSSLMTVS